MATQRSKKGSEKVLGRVLGKGSQKGSELSGTGDSQRDRFARIIRNSNPYFYSASGRFARITRISDSRESEFPRESCESEFPIRATKVLTLRF